MKKVKTGALLLGLLLVLTGCGKNEAKDVDPSVLADTLRNAITFQDELEAVDAAAMGRMYEVDEADIEDVNRCSYSSFTRSNAIVWFRIFSNSSFFFRFRGLS